MHIGDFDYALPQDLIAQQPLPQRSDSRMLVLDGRQRSWRDALIRGLPQQLEPGDLLVFNDTRVIPARLAAWKSTGGRIEIFLERPQAENEALVQLRGGKRLRTGQHLHTDGGEVILLRREGEMWRLWLPQPALEFFERFGSVPLPPYIERVADAGDAQRYQSLLARVPGAVAAPTASLHFDAALFEALAARGVHSAALTLHVGAGTFQPVRSERLEQHVMHAEWYEVPAAVVAAIAETRARGGRVVAVGTTVARALESAAGGGLLLPGADETRLFVYPGFQFRVIDALLTNFHLPKSTLLMLVAAFAGRDTVLAAYAHAVRERYRFFSYGDAMLVWPAQARA